MSYFERRRRKKSTTPEVPAAPIIDTPASESNATTEPEPSSIEGFPITIDVGDVDALFTAIDEEGEKSSVQLVNTLLRSPGEVVNLHATKSMGHFALHGTVTLREKDDTKKVMKTITKELQLRNDGDMPDERG